MRRAPLVCGAREGCQVRYWRSQRGGDGGSAGAACRRDGGVQPPVVRSSWGRGYGSWGGRRKLCGPPNAWNRRSSSPLRSPGSARKDRRYSAHSASKIGVGERPSVRSCAGRMDGMDDGGSGREREGS